MMRTLFPVLVTALLAGVSLSSAAEAQPAKDRSSAFGTLGTNKEPIKIDADRLDYLLHNYAKPLLVWGHGIVMGGGIGLMAGGSHRVVSETSRLAMPEISIGLFPDVGGSWILRQMPGHCGLFLALTGAQLGAALGLSPTTALTALTETPDGALLSLGAGHSILFAGLAPAALSSDDFAIA